MGRPTSMSGLYEFFAGGGMVRAIGNGEGIHWPGKGLARHRSLSVGGSKGGRQQACGSRYGPFSVKSAP